MERSLSRYYQAVRRSQNLRAAISPKSAGTKVAGAVVAGAMLIVPAACGNGDEAVFSAATATSVPTDGVPTDEAPTPVATLPPVAAPTTAVLPTTVAPTAVSPTAIPTSTAEVAVDAGLFPVGGEMLVSFTYTPSSESRAKRPYVAVWLEDTDGNLVTTISLWFQQDRKGTNWLDDLTQWHRASGGEDTTMSSATRVPGDYVVSWDGTDSGGEPVEAGEYVLNIESSREHGPTSFTNGIVTVSAAGFAITLDDDGELTSLAAELAT